MTEKDIYKNGVALLEEWEDVNYCEHSFKFKDKWLTDREVVDLLNSLNDENEQLKKGMIEVVDRYIRNVEHNPPSSARTYLKVKGALNNVREGLRDLLGDLE